MAVSRITWFDGKLLTPPKYYQVVSSLYSVHKLARSSMVLVVPDWLLRNSVEFGCMRCCHTRFTQLWRDQDSPDPLKRSHLVFSRGGWPLYSSVVVAQMSKVAWQAKLGDVG